MTTAIHQRWAGHPASAGASATGIMGGGAATPVAAGSGFNWRSMVQNTAGGLVYRGRGLRGLGQDDGGYVPTPGSIDVVGAPPWATTDGSTTAGSTTTGTGFDWLKNLIQPAITGGLQAEQIYFRSQQPTYMQAGGTLRPLTSAVSPVGAGIGSMLPILLIGGVVLLFVMARK